MQLQRQHRLRLCPRCRARGREQLQRQRLPHLCPQRWCTQFQRQRQPYLCPQGCGVHSSNSDGARSSNGSAGHASAQGANGGASACSSNGGCCYSSAQDAGRKLPANCSDGACSSNGSSCHTSAQALSIVYWVSHISQSCVVVGIKRCLWCCSCLAAFITQMTALSAQPPVVASWRG